MTDFSREIFEQLKNQTSLLGQILEVLQQEVAEEDEPGKPLSYDYSAVYNPTNAQDFVNECMVSASGAELGGDEVLRIWENWCMGRGIQLGRFNKGNQNLLYKSLDLAGVKSKRPTAPDGSRFRIYLDVALNRRGRELL